VRSTKMGGGRTSWRLGGGSLRPSLLNECLVQTLMILCVQCVKPVAGTIWHPVRTKVGVLLPDVRLSQTFEITFMRILLELNLCRLINWSILSSGHKHWKWEFWASWNMFASFEKWISLHL
jgi:hypothetical protein